MVLNYESRRVIPEGGTTLRWLLKTSLSKRYHITPRVFEDRHGSGNVLLLLIRFIFSFVIPRRGRPAGGSSEAGKTRDAREHKKPEKQKSCVDQYFLHTLIIRLRWE